MGSYSSDTESPDSITNPNPSFLVMEKKTKNKKKKKQQNQKQKHQRNEAAVEEEEEEEAWPRKSKGVLLEGYVESEGGENGSEGGGSVGRTKSLTDEDLDELKGCLDLGFGFSYEEIPELCNTLPALELCYSMSQRFLDEQQHQHRSLEASAEAVEPCVAASSSPIANWKISSPGDHPEEVKARLKYWAQAVACTVRLCR